MSAVGFFKKEKWAYPVAVTANVLGLWTSFWPMIPIMDVMAKMETDPAFFPVYLFIFLPNIILYFLINKHTGKRNWGRLLVGLLTGMGLIMGFINGTASLNISYVKNLHGADSSLYVLSSRLFWAAALGYGLITIAIMLIPEKEWVRMLGVGCAIPMMLFGFPMGIITTIEKGEFSMYLGAPLMSVALLILFLIPALWNKIIKPDEK